MNDTEMTDRGTDASAQPECPAPATLREEVLERLTPPRRAILGEHTRHVPDDDIAWGLALVLADFNQDAKTESRRVRAEIAEFGELLQGWHGQTRKELDHTTKQLRLSVSDVVRKHEERDQTAMQQAIDTCLDEAVERVVDARLIDLLRAVSGKVVALLVVTSILGGLAGLLAFFTAPYMFAM